MHRTFGYWMFLIAMLAAAVARAAPAAPPSLTIDVQQRTVTISGITRGGDVTLFSDGIVPDGYDRRLLHRELVLSDTDGTGRVLYTPRVDIESASIWIAVDNATGAYGIAVPASSPFHPIALNPKAFSRNGKGDLTKVSAPFQVIDFLVVRPGEGAWTLTTGDGGADDDDPRPDGHVGCMVGKIKDVGKKHAAKPDKLRKDDVVVGIDPLYFAYFVERIGE